MIKFIKTLRTTHKVLLLIALFIGLFVVFFLIHKFSPEHIHDLSISTLILNNFVVSFFEVVFIFVVIFLLVTLLSYVVIKSDRLERIVNIDELTKVQTRRSFFYNNGDDNKRNFDYLIIIIDIDYFKSVNDSFGHDIGDKYLKNFGNELKKIGVDSLNSVRLGGEEFALLFYLKDIDKKFETAKGYKGFTLTQKINKFLKHIHGELNKIYLDSNSLIIKKTSSIGGALLLKNDKISDSLSYADKALQVVKDNGRNNFKYADKKFISESKKLNEIITLDELRDAMKQGELTFYHQPIIDVKNNSIKYFECLVRWIKPDGTVVLPQYFLSKMVHLNSRSISEGTRLWRPLFKRTFENINVDQKIKFSINIQMSHFTNIGSGKIWLEELEYIKNFIKNEIMIEITETQNTRLDEKVANREIQYLRDNGISVALDDYGVEGSNLERLINTPWNVIKVDKHLVDKVVTDERSRVAVEGIRTMADKLNSEIIAEGVETVEQLKYMKKIGINLVQGFLFSKPMPADQVNGYIEKFSAKYQ